MAILSFYRCEVLVNDVPLAEYDDEDTQDIPHNPTPQAIKYIEATAGSEFAIKFSLLAPWTMEDDLVWKVFLDGSQSTGSLFKKSETTAGVYSKIRDGVNVGSGNDWYWRKYTFGSLILGEATGHLSAKELKAKYSGLGTIRIEVWGFKHQYDEPAKDIPWAGRIVDFGTVPEKALKGQALSLSAGLGRSVRSKKHGYFHGTYTKILATFEFRYRSREALQQLLILPPEVSLEEKRIEDLTVEEARELLRRQKAQPPAARQVKSEETEPNLKRERASTATTNARPLKISRTSDGQEYVDLASESDDGDVKDEGKILGTDTKKADAKIEVIDLLD